MRKIGSIVRSSFFIAVIMLMGSSVHATDISGVGFEKMIKDEGVQMDLQGAGLKSVFFLKAFAAGFYKGEDVESYVLGEFPKRIEVEYFVSIPAEKMNNFTIKSMQENVTKEEFAQISEEVSVMGQYFVNLKPGDRYSLTYIPGLGTKFAYNGELVGTIQGENFAKALFSTWLGNEPFDRKLKEKILGSENIEKFKSKNIVRIKQ